jgi:hypothetical protein
MQQSRPNCCKTWLSKFPTRSKRIDVISRIIFPLVFALFNLIYWYTTYLFQEEVDYFFYSSPRGVWHPLAETALLQAEMHGNTT